MPLTARTGMCVNTALLIKCVLYTNTTLVCLLLSTTSGFNFLTTFDVFKSFVGCVYDSDSKLTASPSKSFSERCSQLFVSMAIPIGQNSGGGKLFVFYFLCLWPIQFPCFYDSSFHSLSSICTTNNLGRTGGFFVVRLALGSL